MNSVGTRCPYCGAGYQRTTREWARGVWRCEECGGEWVGPDDAREIIAAREADDEDAQSWFDAALKAAEETGS